MYVGVILYLFHCVDISVGISVCRFKCARASECVYQCVWVKICGNISVCGYKCVGISV